MVKLPAVNRRIGGSSPSIPASALCPKNPAVSRVSNRFYSCRTPRPCGLPSPPFLSHTCDFFELVFNRQLGWYEKYKDDIEKYLNKDKNGCVV